MRSRNCRPRLVYFLAIEITRRRFASTISFLARRARASPILILRLISLISAIESPVASSTLAICRCKRWISSLCSVILAPMSFLRAMRPTQRASLSEPWKLLMNSFRSMRHSRTTMRRISRSGSRTAVSAMRASSISGSKTRGVSLKNLNSSPSLFISVTASL